MISSTQTAETIKMAEEILSSSSPKVATCLVFLLLALNNPALGEGGRRRRIRSRVQVQPAEMMFFLLEDLKPGAQMELYFPPPASSTYPVPLPRFISREEADSIPIPFSSDHLPQLLEFFSIPPGSWKAQAMEATLAHCGARAMVGETKTCATSREFMLDFVGRALAPLGVNDSILGMSTRQYYYRRGGTPLLLLQNYTVLGRPSELLARPDHSLVGCHLVYYPYKVFYCHSLAGENKAFLVDLVGVDTGDRVVAAAACHMDTSHWGAGHAAFRVLGVEPGFPGGVCHIFPQDDILFVPRRNAVANPAAAAE